MCVRWYEHSLIENIVICWIAFQLSHLPFNLAIDTLSVSFLIYCFVYCINHQHILSHTLSSTLIWIGLYVLSSLYSKKDSDPVWQYNSMQKKKNNYNKKNKRLLISKCTTVQNGQSSLCASYDQINQQMR